MPCHRDGEFAPNSGHSDGGGKNQADESGVVSVFTPSSSEWAEGCTFPLVSSTCIMKSARLCVPDPIAVASLGKGPTVCPRRCP